MNRTGYDFSLLKAWAENLLDSNMKGMGTEFPVLSDQECLNDGVVSIREIQILSCEKPYRLCFQYSSRCSPLRVRISNPPDKSAFGLKMLQYKTALEQIVTGGCTVELIREIVILCHHLHNLADLEGQRRSLTRAALRYQQNGRCVFPGCKKERGLHMHRCLPGYLGGEYSEDNVVLVCTLHHPQLEQFRNKLEVAEYLNYPHLAQELKE